MQRIRLTISRNPNDPVDDLRCAANLQWDLWAHSSVGIDPGSPRHRTRRDAERNAFFEFATDHLPEVHRVLQQFGYDGRVRIDVVEEGAGTECINCGYIPPQLEAVCSRCGFRDIEPCPYCDNEVARLNYVPIRADLFKCPMCQRKVRLELSDPAFDGNGDSGQPFVRVSPGEAPVGYDV